MDKFVNAKNIHYFTLSLQIPPYAKDILYFHNSQDKIFEINSDLDDGERRNLINSNP